MLIKVIFVFWLYQTYGFASSFALRCAPNEELVQNSTTCSTPTCEFRHPPCHRPQTVQRPSCRCKSGFISLNYNSKTCIQDWKCPSTCSRQNFFWNNCGTRCPRTCQQKDPDPCIKICEPGCFCIDGMILNEVNMECVKEEDCPT